jgi:hypothetical protein
MLYRLLAVLTVVACAATAGAENIVFPEDSGIVDVTKPPYNLKGDGRTDNTPALREAFLKLRGTNSTLYFPNGTYLFSDRVNISGDEPSKAHSKDRFLNLQGQSQARTILRLKDKAPGYDNPDKPKTFISLYEGDKTGDAMHTYVRNLTFDVGKGNPGAAGLRFLANNTGAIYDVTIRSSDPTGAGALGLDLRQPQQGPSFQKNITIEGFDYGIQTGNSFSLVFEHITLRNQRKAGILNAVARSTIRGLKSDNKVPALVTERHGQMTLIEATLTGGSAGSPAIISGTSSMFLRDISVSGYGATVKTSNGKTVTGDIDEWHEGQAYALFDAPKKTLRLPIEETPEVPWETDLSKWVKVEPNQPDSIQKAIDDAARRGATTVYFPRTGGKNAFVVDKPIRVHGSVNRIIGMEVMIRISDKLAPGEAAFVFEDLDGPIVFERFFNILVLDGWKGLWDRYLFEHKSDHPVIIRNIAHGACMHKKPAPGRTWFIEDIAGARMALFGKDEKVWMRQYNPESPELDMCRVDGGQAWILGLKTEGRSRHIVATNGARVELLGGVSYQSWNKQPLDPPCFTVTDSEASLTVAFYEYNLPFTTAVEQTRNGDTLSLSRKQVKGSFMPLYRATSGESAARAHD